MLTTLMFGAFASLASLHAIADEPSYVSWIRVSDLMKTCKGEKVWEQAYCVGYVVGVADVANNDQTSLKVCVPKAVTQAQMKAVIVKYLEHHPEESQYAAFSSVRAALRDAFPCQPRLTM